MARKFTKYPSSYVKSSETFNGPRYMALLGFNTKQLWIYDELEDVYIDPPTEVLNALTKDPDAAEAELERIANEEQPDWLLDEDYWYDAEDTDI